MHDLMLLRWTMEMSLNQPTDRAQDRKKRADIVQTVKKFYF
jgi:hypothetical protein